MNGNLAQWQLRLDRHFGQLAALRQRAANAHPLFALEHGLNAVEIEELFVAIRRYIAQQLPNKDHALAWIVYAAELGYRFAGDEYWQTFEEETPGWTINGDRYWLRERYREFQEKYGGAKPSGAWAQHFSIICWPITHAILPLDLQRQLARILYEIRHAFSSELLESPKKLGEVIHARSWNATSRFQNLAQETELVGQIAAALLFQGQYGTDGMIYPPTLDRISDDLDRERKGREWLRSARRTARERVQIRGLGRPWSPHSRGSEEGRERLSELGIEPRLIMRPTEVGGESWEVAILIPDLSHLLLRFPHLRDILTSSRCTVAGAGGRPLARGRCLHGSQRVVLSKWPLEGEVLLHFERSDPQLDYLMRAECLLRPGPSWLFRIASDGLAYELRSIRVRPGERYILATTNHALGSVQNVHPINLNCAGIHGVFFELPEALTTDWQETLERLGVTQARAIQVWPAGLDASLWDGEGRGEWLASERPCLAITSDHPIESLTVSLLGSDESQLKIEPVVPGEPVFVELPNLSVGLHKVRVAAQSSDSDEAGVLGDLDVVMRIREVRPWEPGVSPHGPLLLQVDPPMPTLEQLWEEQVIISLQGPSGRTAKCRVSLFERENDTAIVTSQLPPMTYPVTAAIWRSHFKNNFRTTRQAKEAYDSAKLCELEFTAEELGAFTIRCERAFTPLRWAIRRHDDTRLLRLLDDSGDDSEARVSLLSFEYPCTEEQIFTQADYEVPEEGGLYVARGSRTTAAVIVPPPLRTLQDLGCTPRVHKETRSVDNIVDLLHKTNLWGHARGVGDFGSTLRKRNVLVALLREIIRLTCGGNWARIEDTLYDQPLALSQLQNAISRRDYWAEIGEVVGRDVAQLAEMTCEDRVNHISSLARHFHLLSTREGIEWLSELSLRLVSDPANVQAWAGERLREGLDRLLEASTLVRVARLVVLMVDAHLDSRVAPGELYAGWEWA